ncbi:hypothetical protein LSH36_67g02026 [Paralvinella palmiformis]|uniref:Uncharacterized protein n=1 Tax=Paralvinella palmiformis TaxID=53620 RepID=A0AAD9K4Z9_9ANNE|nr:hypothetical protein LSH36_67g02026 [Paralvinella palmiformis]
MIKNQIYKANANKLGTSLKKKEIRNNSVATSSKQTTDKRWKSPVDYNQLLPRPVMKVSNLIENGFMRNHRVTEFDVKMLFAKLKCFRNRLENIYKHGSSVNYCNNTNMTKRTIMA